MKVFIDTEQNEVKVTEADQEVRYPLDSPEAFSAVSETWLRCGWDTKYAYSFSWMGRPIIQIPEDMIRMQEVIYQVKPDVLIETGVAYGGSLIFYASLLKAMGKGRVVGIDIEIRPHNREAIESHEMFSEITLLEGSSTSPEIVSQVKDMIKPGETVMVILDSNHTKDHVLAELEAYASMVSVGSYIVATDGIMQDLVGAPRSQADWGNNNPQQAALAFVEANPNFVIAPPSFPFNESVITDRVTYWPNAWIRRLS